MFEGQARGEIVIQNDVRDPGNFAMAGNRHGGQRAPLVAHGVDGNQALGGALLKKKRIFLNEVPPVTVADHKIKIPFLKKMILDSGHHHSRISFADFRNHDSDREAALLTEGARHKTGTIIQFARGRADALLRGMRDGLRAGRPVDHQRNGGRRQAKVLGESFQADGTRTGGRVVSIFAMLRPWHWDVWRVVCHKRTARARPYERRIT